jgi:hypothetical protein
MLPKKVNDLPVDEIILGDTNLPRLITPTYSTNHFIVADYVLNPSNSDMSDSIQNALNSCYQNGGGTVWLNKGIYYVSKSISIPSGCTLMGDYESPGSYGIDSNATYDKSEDSWSKSSSNTTVNTKLDYGTKIVVDVNGNNKYSSSKIEQTGLFIMSSSSGIEGITIYYKNQNIENPKPQPWSIYTPPLLEDIAEPGKGPGMLYTIKNVTLLNSYLGIGRGLLEGIGTGMLRIENVKGTVIKKGVQIHNSGESSSITSLSLLPEYLAYANLKAFNDNSSNKSIDTIMNAIKKNEGIGLYLTDSELAQYIKIDIKGYKYGIYIPVRPTDQDMRNLNNTDVKVRARSTGSGEFYNLNISNCNYGIFADSKENTLSFVATFVGYVITSAYIEGSDYSIYINTPIISSGSKKGQGTIKLNGVELVGKTGGNGGLIYYDEETEDYLSLPKGEVDSEKISRIDFINPDLLYRNLKNNGKTFKYLSSGSSVDDINRALNEVSQSGGGVVYLKPGLYTINNTINIPKNVELRGSFASSGYRAAKRNGSTNGKPNDGISKGTIIRITSDMQNISPVVINGDNSGLSGIYFIYETNIKSLASVPSEAQKNNFVYPYTVTIVDSKNAYINNVTIIGGSNGVYLSNCKDFVVQNLVTSIFSNVIKMDKCKNGLVKNTLQNGSFIDLNLLYYGNGTVFNDIARKYLTYAIVNSSTNIDLVNVFAYGPNVLVSAKNTESLLGLNMSHDGANDTNSKYVIASSTKGALVNNFTFNENIKTITSLSGGSLGLYNNHNMYNINEKDIPGTLQRVMPASKGASIEPATREPTTSSVLGDVNGDGKVSSQDYILIRKHIVGTKLTGDNLKRADIDNDGKVGLSDYTIVRKIIIGTYNKTTTTTNTTTTKSTPTINAWSSTSLKNTTITSQSATTTICNLGTDKDGLKTIEYSTNCTSAKTASISNGCATITISACANSVLSYRIKGSGDYSSKIIVSDIGKNIIFAQIYNQFLYPGTSAFNNSSNIGFWMDKNQSVSKSVKEIGDVAINNRSKDSNETYIKYLYKGIVGRTADTNGLNSWIKMLDNGKSRKDVLSSFISSNETKLIYSSWGYN